MLGFSTFTDVDQNGVTVVTLLGLGLSVDYGLLLVARYREELAAGLRPRRRDRAGPGPPPGRTIVFSALTVAAALDRPADVRRAHADRARRRRRVDRAGRACSSSLTFTAALIGLFRRRDPAAPAPRRAGRAARTRTRGLLRRPRPARAAPAAAGRAWPPRRCCSPPALPLLSLDGAAARPGRAAAQHRGGPGRRRARPPGSAAPTAPADHGRRPHRRGHAATRGPPRWRGDPAVARVRPARPAAAGPGRTVGIDVVGDPQGAGRPRARATRSAPTGRRAGSPGSPATPPSSATCSA